MSSEPKHASGYDFEPLPDGRFLLEFYAEDGYTFAEAIVSRDQLEKIPAAVAAILTYLEEHGTPERGSLDYPDRMREEFAKRRRHEMGLE